MHQGCDLQPVSPQPKCGRQHDNRQPGFLAKRAFSGVSQLDAVQGVACGTQHAIQARSAFVFIRHDAGVLRPTLRAVAYFDVIS
jgi:hypothetical protein